MGTKTYLLIGQVKLCPRLPGIWNKRWTWINVGFTVWLIFLKDNFINCEKANSRKLRYWPYLPVTSWLLCLRKGRLGFGTLWRVTGSPRSSLAPLPHTTRLGHSFSWVHPMVSSHILTCRSFPSGWKTTTCWSLSCTATHRLEATVALPTLSLPFQVLEYKAPWIVML